ncbi:hypothetical protein AB0C98_10535 [Streptomyces sp. NPDC048558]|uniref:hypothetical protein n=1 Tax=Streptomyces sp. NPDC048558 TaxID=3155759 RepID=UPI00340C4152
MGQGFAEGEERVIAVAGLAVAPLDGAMVGDEPGGAVALFTVVVVTWCATGANIEANGGRNGISAQGCCVIASRHVYRSGLTPGGQVSLIPGWNICSGSSGSGTDVFVLNGQLTVEYVL